MILLIHCGSSKTPHISTFLTQKEVPFEQVELAQWDPDLYSFDKISGCIISGAPILLTNPKNLDIVLKFNFLKNPPFPVLGVCFGHQVLGMIHGAVPFLGEARRSVEVITVVQPKSILFDGFQYNALEFQEDHTEGIHLPGRFTLLASSPHYEIEAMKHNDLPLFGVQFHPEVSGENGERILNNFLLVVDKKQYPS